MSTTRPDATSRGADRRFNGWKEIPAYLGKSSRTVQRWERDYGLPIHRIGHKGGEIIIGYQGEIDAWLSGARTALDASLPPAGAADLPAPGAAPDVQAGDYRETQPREMRPRNPPSEIFLTVAHNSGTPLAAG